jgi:hypothetical protein
MSGPAYVTRETVQTVGGFGSVIASKIDRAIFTQSRNIENQLLRHFYPLTEAHTFHDPYNDTSHVCDPGFWLNRDLLSATAVTVDGTAASSYTLLPKQGPPYDRIIVDGFDGLDTIITGDWGWSNDTKAAGTLAADITTTTAVTCDVDGDAAATIGVGDLMSVNTERMIVTGRTAIDSTANLNGALTADANNQTVTITDGSGFAVGEELLVESERMLILDIATNDLTVERAFRGSTLAAHNDATDVFAYRRLTIDRGATGTTAIDTSVATDAITVNVPPAPIRDWCLGEVLNQIAQETGAYARVVGSGDNQQEARGAGLKDLRREGARLRRYRTGAV